MPGEAGGISSRQYYSPSSSSFPFTLFSCRRSRADLVVSIGVLVVLVVVVVVLEPLPLLSE